MSNNVKLGIIGSGQLSMMLCDAAQKLKIKTIVLSENDGPAINHCDEFIHTSYKDKNNLKIFAENIDVATLEFENVPYEVLKFIENYKPIFPSPDINKIVQNRLLEKKFFSSLNIPTTKYKLIERKEDLENEKVFFPGILKSLTGGYDGHFSYKINNINELKKMNIDFSKKYIFEKIVKLKKEISIIATRYQNKEINIFEPFENIHEHQILKKTIIPANLSQKIIDQAKLYTTKILEKHNYIGTIAVEYFISENENLLGNETASRVHNSGHITIDASNSSQFDQHIRAVCNLKIVKLKKMKKGHMLNILGNDILKHRNQKFSSNKFFKDYEKKDIREKRKMGHINFIEN